MKRNYILFIILILVASAILTGCSKDQDIIKSPDIPEVEKVQKVLDDISAAIMANDTDRLGSGLADSCPGRQLELDKLKEFAGSIKLKEYSQSVISAKRLRDGVACTVNVRYEGFSDDKNISRQFIRNIYFIFENGIWRIGDFNYYPYSNPTVIVGSDSSVYDAAYLMSDSLSSRLRTDTEHLQTYGDIIMVGTPYDNASILYLEEKGLTPVKVTEDYPGSDIGIVQVLSNVENYRHVIIIQGSSTRTAEDAIRFMTQYLKDSPYINPGVYFTSEDNLRKATPLELTTLVTLDIDKADQRLKEVQRHTEANIEVITQELLSEKEQLQREQSYLHSKYTEDMSRVFSRYDFYPEQSLYDSMILINANFTDNKLCESAFSLPYGSSSGTAYTFTEYANRVMSLEKSSTSDDRGILLGGSTVRTHIASELNGSINSLEASCISTALLRLIGFSSTEAFSITTDEDNALYFNIDNGYAAVPGSPVLYNPELQYPVGELLSVYNDAAFLSYENENTNLGDDEVASVNTRAKELFRLSARSPKDMPEKTPFRKSELDEKLDLPYDTEDIYSLLRSTFVDDYTINSFSTLDEARDNLRAAMGRLLAVKCTRFIVNAASRYPSSQYDFAIYAAGLMNVEYPNAYAEAAEASKQLKELSSGISNLLSDNSAKTQKIIDVLADIEDYDSASDMFLHPDYCIIKKTGGHKDKALLAFGLYSNLIGSSEDAYVVLGESSSYLVYKEDDQWKYLDCKYNALKDYLDDDIKMTFNKEFVYNRELNTGDIPEFAK